MYEAWLVVNILWEMALDVAPWLLTALAAWLFVTALAWQRARTHWRVAMPTALTIAAIVAVVGFFTLPALTGSSLAQLSYWVDWATLLGMALAAGALGFAGAWPLAALWRQRRQENATTLIAPSSRHPPAR